MPGYLIRRLQQTQLSLFAQFTAPLDVPPMQFAALALIDAHPDLDQASLAGGIGCDPVTAGGIINRLEAKAWIIRRVDPADKRSRLLRIEPQGREVLRKMLPGVAQTQQMLMEPLSTSEQKQFIELIQKILQAHNDSTRVPQMDPSRKTRKTKNSP